MISRKYGRTYHYPFSPGTTSDDRINHTYTDDISHIRKLVHTEKLDGENNCLNRYGVFARSHAAPTQSPWTKHLRDRWELVKADLCELEIFGENLYAVHSIEYQQLDSYFYVFAVREQDQWLSWEETVFYAQLLEFPVVPVLAIQQQPVIMAQLETDILSWANQPSVFGSADVMTGTGCTREGIVTRNADSFPVAEFSHNVFKYVRKGHVKTDEHWTRNWHRAKLAWEKS